ncbi:MAG: hypothetical protein K6F77_06040 [Lachnospiraceae bacterium]|nr:hypothetical protein [Lachnospiraceae bacterium]
MKNKMMINYKRLRKAIISAILSFSLAIPGNMMTASADSDEYDFNIMVSSQEMLINALENARGSSEKYCITLSTNITVNTMLSLGGNLTLDLHGYAINRGNLSTDYGNCNSDGGVMKIVDGANVTIMDSDPTTTHTGHIDGAPSTWFAGTKSGCTAIDVNGGIITGGGNSNGGGGVTIGDNATLTLKGGTIIGNVSSDGGGGVLINGNDKSKFILAGGNITLNGAYHDNGGGVYIQNGLFEATSGDINDNWSSENSVGTGGCGAGVYVDNETERVCYIHGTDISTDDGEKRSVQIFSNYGEDDGAGIYINEGTSYITNASFIKNRTDGYGGGIMVNDDGSSGNYTTIAGCYFDANNASDDGGAIHVDDEEYVAIGNCVITNNTSNGDGGGISFNSYTSTTADVSCSISDCTVTGNSADGSGDGIYLYDPVKISGKMVVKNNGDQNLYLDNEDLYLGTLSADSELYITKRSGWEEGDIVSEGTTQSQDKYLFGDGGYYFEKVTDVNSEDYRKIKFTYNAPAKNTSKSIEVWDEVNKDTSSDASNLGSTMVIDETKEYLVNHKFPVYKGYFRHDNSTSTKEDFYTSVFYYSDGLFFDYEKNYCAEDYNKHLAALSASFAVASSMAAKGYSSVNDPETQINRFNYVTQMFSDIGCTNDSMYVNDYYQKKPEANSIGIAMANKKIYEDNTGDKDDEYILIPIVVRSGNYGLEWISNVTLGTEGEAAGFSKSADIAMENISEYIDGHPEVKEALNNGRVKFYMSGFSRGGAVTNLVTKRLTDLYCGGTANSIKGNEVFGYCIAAPQGGIEDLDREGGYPNIHNVINKSDIVPLVGPYQMGFKRYGVDHYLPGDEAQEVKTSTKEWGFDASEPTKKSVLTTYSDNNSFAVNYSDTNYMNLRDKFVKQFAVTFADSEFDDYFKPAEINYISSTSYIKWMPFVGNDMITEVEYSDFDTKEKFAAALFDRLLKYSANASNAGHDWAKEDDAKDSYHKDSYNYREFYSTDTKSHFKPGSKYANSGCVSLEKMAQELFGVLLDSEAELNMDNFGDIASNISMADVYFEVIGDIYTDNTAEEYTKWLDTIWNLLGGELSEEQKAKGYQNLRDIYEGDFDKLEGVYPTLVAMLLDFVNDDYNDTDGNQILLGTAAYNAANLIADHFTYIGWTRADDPWYQDDTDVLNKANVTASKPDKTTVLMCDASAEGLYEEPIEDVSGVESPDEDEVNELNGDTVVFLRTQAGGSAYYDLEVNGESVAENVLFQDLQGIKLEAGNEYKLTTFCYAYEQKSETAEYTFKVNKKTNDIIASDITVTYGDKTATIGAVSKNNAEVSCSITSGSSVDVIDITTDGAITTKKVGETSVDIVVDESENYVGATKTVNVKVVPRELVLEWEETSFTYDGESHVPTVKVSGVLEDDECVVRVLGEQTEVGKYTATAEIENENYVLPENSSVEFEIVEMKEEVSPAPDVSASPEITSTPSETAKPSESAKPSETLAPDNSGTAAPSATNAPGDIGNSPTQTASATKTPTPSAVSTPSTVENETITLAKAVIKKVKVKKTKKKNKYKVIVKVKKVEGADGYEFKISKKKKFKAAKTKVVKKKKAKIKMKKAKKYFVKVRAYKEMADGSKIYGKWSKKKKVKVKKKKN